MIPRGFLGAVPGRGRRAQTILSTALIALIGACITSTAARAQVGAGQVAPPSSPIERAIPPEQPRALPPLPITPAPELPAEQAGQVVTIHKVTVEGATVYPQAEVEGFFADLVDKPTRMGDVAARIGQLQAKYRGDGYFLTVVRGNVERDALRVRVVEGFISSVKLDGDIGPAGVQVYRFLSKLTEERPARLSEVERALLLSQDVPGISIRAVLRPGSGEPGAVDLIAQVGRKPFDAFVQVDNRASPFAGPWEMLVGASANSFTSFGERSEAIIYDTPFNDEQIFGQATLEGFVGGSGLKLRTYVGYGPSNPGGALAVAGFHSNVLLAGIGASYPIIRTRPLSLFVNLAFDISQTEVDTNVAGASVTQSIDNLRIVRLGENLTFQDDTLGLGQTGANLFNLTVHQGLSGLGAQFDPASRAGARLDFTKLSGELTRVQDLFQAGNFQFALKLSAGGQYSGDILPSSEKYFLGGTRYGRGFFSGEVTGDSALGTTVELQVNTSTDVPWHIGLQPYVYYDNGWSWDNGTDPTTTLSQHLSSTGVGVRAAFTPQISGELELAHRFTRQPTGANVSPEGANVVLTGVTARF